MAYRMLRASGMVKAPKAARCGCRYPNPPPLAGIVAMSDAWVGRLSLLVSVMKRKKKSSVVSMALRKGVVHWNGSPRGGVPFGLYVLRMFVPMRWAIAG